MHFVAVYGRRRVGKTFLIREAFEALKDVVRQSSEKKKSFLLMSYRGWIHKKVI